MANLRQRKVAIKMRAFWQLSEMIIHSLRVRLRWQTLRTETMMRFWWHPSGSHHKLKAQLRQRAVTTEMMITGRPKSPLPYNKIVMAAVTLFSGDSLKAGAKRMISMLLLPYGRLKWPNDNVPSTGNGMARILQGSPIAEIKIDRSGAEARLQWQHPDLDKGTNSYC